MSIVIAKKYDNKIEFAADSIIVWESTKKTNGVKLFRISESFCIGFVGNYEQNMLLINIMSESELNEYSHTMYNLYSYIATCLQKLTKVMSVNNRDIDLDINMLVGFNKLLFNVLVENNCLYIEFIKDYHCIGSGKNYGFGAMAMEATPIEAAKAVTEICLTTAQPILSETIYF